MEYTIWKYLLDTKNEQEIWMKGGGKLLCVQWQGHTPCIWKLCRPDATDILYRIFTVGTGRPADQVVDKEYVGTFQTPGGSVLHVFVQEIH